MTLLRANVTAGPVPDGSAGAWGGRSPDLTMPEAWMAETPNVSVATRVGSTPWAVSAAPMSRMKASGPQT